MQRIKIRPSRDMVFKENLFSRQIFVYSLKRGALILLGPIHTMYFPCRFSFFFHLAKNKHKKYKYNLMFCS